MNYILFAIFVILQVLDFWTTYKCLTMNKGHEANPVVAFAITKIGLVPALAIYKLFAIAIGWVIKDVWFVMLALDIAYAKIIWNNFKVLK